MNFFFSVCVFFVWFNLSSSIIKDGDTYAEHKLHVAQWMYIVWLLTYINTRAYNAYKYDPNWIHSIKDKWTKRKYILQVCNFRSNWLCVLLFIRANLREFISLDLKNLPASYFRLDKASVGFISGVVGNKRRKACITSQTISKRWTQSDGYVFYLADDGSHFL